MLRRLLTYFKPYKGLLALDLVCAFLLAGFDLFYQIGRASCRERV